MDEDTIKNLKKGRSIKRPLQEGFKAALRLADHYASGGDVWDKPRPKSLGKPKHLTPKQKSTAKAAAKAAGRPWPNMIDNIRAARGK